MKQEWCVEIPEQPNRDLEGEEGGPAMTGNAPRAVGPSAPGEGTVTANIWEKLCAVTYVIALLFEEKIETNLV